MHPHQVSVVIPAYNNQPLLAKYLPPLLKVLDARGLADEVIVADDAGQDGTEAFLANGFPAVRYIRNEVNGGFGAACNAGIGIARHKYILLLNSDVRVTENFLEPLFQHFQQSDVFSVVPKIIWPVDPPVNQSVTSYHFHTGRLGLLWDENSTSKEPLPVIFPVAACALFDAEKLREIGCVDPLYRPYYWEDVDLGYVAWKRGWRCLYEPGATVFHESGATITQKTGNKRAIISTRNACLFFWKNITDWRFCASYLFFMPLRSFSLLVKRRDPVMLQGFFAALPRLGEALAARRREKGKAVRTDRQIAHLFK